MELDWMIVDWKGDTCRVEILQKSFAGRTGRGGRFVSIITVEMDIARMVIKARGEVLLEAAFSMVFICGEGFGVTSVCLSLLADLKPSVAPEIELELL